MAGQPYSPDEETFLRALVRSSGDRSNLELARQFSTQYPGRTQNAVRIKVEAIKREPPAKDESAEVQEWTRRREAALAEVQQLSPSARIRERLGMPIKCASRDDVTSSAVSIKQPSNSIAPGLIIPDVHAPYHDKSAWALMMSVARVIKPQWIASIGDFGDFYAVSSHDKDPARAHRFDEELEVVDGLLDELDALGATSKLFVEGNHEDRLRRYLQRSPELSGVVSTEKPLRLPERGWEFVPYKEHKNRGAVHFTHDVGVSTRYAAFRALDLYQHSVVTGHTHRLQYIVEGTATGDCKVSAMFGWLGDVEQVDYMNKAKARRNWALAFGLGYHDTATDFVYLVPVPIVHNTCCVNGVVYRAA